MVDGCCPFQAGALSPTLTPSGAPLTRPPQMTGIAEPTLEPGEAELTLDPGDAITMLADTEGTSYAA